MTTIPATSNTPESTNDVSSTERSKQLEVDIETTNRELELQEDNPEEQVTKVDASARSSQENTDGQSASTVEDGASIMREDQDVPLISNPPSIPPSRPSSENSVVNAHIASLRLLLTTWVTHFRSLGYVKDSTMELLDRTVCKRTVELTVRDIKAREAIGTSEKVWTELVDLFRVALPSLEGRTYSPPPLPLGGASYDGATGVDNGSGVTSTAPTNLYDPGVSGPSSNVMVANQATLLRDLQRLDSILALARNVLTAGERCQNLAAQVGFDREVCAIVNLCVKVTARGFDGDGQPQDEEKWNSVVNGFKKLLITCLQFLSNLVTNNERLKLMLWVELFDSSADSGMGPGSADGQSGERNLADSWITSATNALMNQQQQSTKNFHIKVEQGAQNSVTDTSQANEIAARSARSAHRITLHEDEHTKHNASKPLRPNTPYFLFLQEHRDKIKADLSAEGEPTTKQLVQEGTRRWNAMPEKERQEWRQRYSVDFDKYKHDLETWKAAGSAGSLGAAKADHTTQQVADVIEILKLDGNRDLLPDASTMRDEIPRTPVPHKQLPYHTNPDLFSPLNYGQPDYHMLESAADGAKKLADGKSQLLKRLENANAHAMQPPPVQSPTSPIEEDIPLSPVEDDLDVLPEEEEDDDDEQDEESEEEESSDEEDYAVPGEDGRGLLTDVPLILGPNEIEVLPMIIMSGIVAPTMDVNRVRKDSAPISEGVINMYTIRCHLLLAQENGRNLLRELLIFVAAWDLREEELYFKFMVKIMEAILMNGLMPFAYNAFKESKDIISPAQAVIMKLLTKIFHARQAFIGGPNILHATPRPEQSTQSTSSLPSAPLRFDIQIVHFLFSEFRQNIIPQICALIFLQGQIRLGFANLEDFPLNLWDMERMYEGVYQYLEFFAILTDHDSWKQLMADWEVTYELVTLLRELEIAIPKGRLGPLPSPLSIERRTSMPARMPSPSPPSSVHPASGPTPMAVAVERPYEVSSPPSVAAHLQPPNDHIGTGSASATPSPYPEQMHDEPADFEWRNLKKLCVLVLSSLVWKNKRLQDQVRDFGGITAILSCCAFDEHNPYIREHAIMCLRFLLEGNRENQDMVRGFAELDADAARTNAEISVVGTGNNAHVHVPREVLDSRGYETYMDGKGKVGLRRKEAQPVLRENLDQHGFASAMASSIGSSSRQEQDKVMETAREVWSKASQLAQGQGQGFEGLSTWMQTVVGDVPPSVPK